MYVRFRHYYWHSGHPVSLVWPDKTGQTRVGLNVQYIRSSLHGQAWRNRTKCKEHHTHTRLCTLGVLLSWPFSNLVRPCVRITGPYGRFWETIPHLSSTSHTNSTQDHQKLKIEQAVTERLWTQIHPPHTHTHWTMWYSGELLNQCIGRSLLNYSRIQMVNKSSNRRTDRTLKVFTVYIFRIQQTLHTCHQGLRTLFRGATMATW